MQSREEGTVDGGWLEVFKFLGHITCHSEVGILIDGGWDQTCYIFTCAEDVGERVTEGGSGLNWWESKFSDIVRLIKAENAFDLIEIDVLLYTDHIGIQVLNVSDVRKNESLLWIKTKGDDILDVVDAHLDCTILTFKFILRLVDILFIVGDLDDERHIKSLLQVLCEEEWDRVPHVQRISTGTTACVQVEGLLLLVGVQDLSQVSLAEEDATSDEPVNGLAR